MFRSPGEIFVQVGPVNIYYYGIFIALAIVCGFGVSFEIMKKFYSDLQKDSLIDLFLWIVPFGIIGARVYYIIVSWAYYSHHLSEILMIQNGGLSIHGAILGGILGGYLFIRKNNLDFLKYADIISYGLPVAQAVGRWGNFFNSEAYGKPADSLWAVYIPIEKRHL